jgi:hypothetical protein
MATSVVLTEVAMLRASCPDNTVFEPLFVCLEP